MKTIIFFIVYLITLPIKPIALLFIQITQILSNPQKYKSNKILETNPIYEPKVPPLDARGAWISNPDHSCSRTGEIIDVNLSPKETLKRFVLADGELTRAPDGNRAVGDVSGDQLCGWLLGYTSPWNDSKKPVEELEKLSDWLWRNHNAPTQSMDCGFRRNPLLVGAQAVLPLALYWTAWKETKNPRHLFRYIGLNLIGYGYLVSISSAYLHFYPKMLVTLSDMWKDKYGPLPHNPRSLYNDANIMRCLAVLIRQTSGLHRLYFKACAWWVWYQSKNWHLPFMDFYGIGKIRPETHKYVGNHLALLEVGSIITDDTTAPILTPKWGESWDDERYCSGLSNKNSIGPWFEYFYYRLKKR